ncbi:carboxypeptidase regulatory-like domain-containing protein [Microbacterium sp. 2MCAF23]|uniref:carboxypeptidase regulatory-like domain-containing protein n=1 Tax=Microbacterium sp. 2MCAF23 TaxID=3232985 RepID=UPI003F96B0A8
MTARMPGHRRWKSVLTALLAAGLMFTGVGAASAAPAAGTGTISGTVTRAADGLPAAGVHVDVSGANGYFFTSTDDTGAYQIPNAKPGQYSVRFSDPYQELATQWWDGAASAQDATPITVADGSEVTGIDAQLAATVSIRGSVLIDGSTDLRGHSSSLAVVAEADGHFVGMTYVHADGTYGLKIAPGTYTVKVEGTEGFAWAVAPQYYSHADSAADATPVVVSGAGDTTGIDFDLSSLTADVALSSGTAHPGDAVHVTASGFAHGEPVQIELHSTPVVLASVTAGADGTIDTTVTIPADVAAGDHQIVLVGAMSTLSGGAPLTVTAAPAPGGSDGSGSGSGSAGTGSDSSGSTETGAQLAATGKDVPVGIVGLGVLLLVAGAALMRIRRRQQA